MRAICGVILCKLSEREEKKRGFMGRLLQGERDERRTWHSEDDFFCGEGKFVVEMRKVLRFHGIIVVFVGGRKRASKGFVSLKSLSKPTKHSKPLKAYKVFTSLENL